MRKYIFFLLLCIIIGNSAAQNFKTAQEQQASQILQSRKEICIKFLVSSKALINEDLTKIMSVDKVKPLPGGQEFEVHAYANHQEFQEFLTRNIPYEIITSAQPKAITMATTVAQMANWDRYPTYSVYEQMMANFAGNYPALCDIDTILSPTPSGNYKILVAKISDNVHTAENEPQFLYSSSMHGNETAGYYLMLRLINYLLSNYGSVPQVTNLLNGAEIWICPLANPDGTYYNSSPAGSTVANGRRYNLASIDLNRNYPDPLDGDHPDGNPWAAETIAFMDFANNHHFVMGANFHSGAEVMNYPWDTWTTSGNSNADAAWWERICSNYVATARTVDSDYMTDTYSDGVTEGGDWYVITGGRQDYMNYFKHCREVTIELDSYFITPTENLNTEWNKNYNSLINYLQESLCGIRGIITDSCSGQPVRAKVFANGYDQANDSSHVYSALPVGNYHKYVNTGTYSLTFSAPGYISKTISSISVTNGTATVVNVVLVPSASPDAQFTGTVTDKCTGTVQFTNTSIASTNFAWYFGDGSTSTLANPSHSYSNNGTYTVKLKAFNCKGVDSLIRSNYISIAGMAVTPTVTNASNCGPGTVTLAASALGTIKWYDAASGGTLLNTGTTYVTPVLSNTTTYYVENDERGTIETAGKTFVQSGGSGTSSGEHYLIFDAFTPLTLISVNVYNTSANPLSRTIALKNSSGAVINGQTTTVNIPAGLSTVNLNFAVPPGTAMRLSCNEGLYLYRHNSGVSYSYTTPGLLSITGTDAGSTYYYYFYEWLVQKDACVSPRSPVTATILTLPVAGFSSSVNSNTATFTNTSANATSHLWSFGDSGTSTQQHPVHTYAAAGTYTVRLITTNGGCSDTAFQNVTITGGSTYSISGKTRYAGKANAGNPAPSYPTCDAAIYNIGQVIVILKNYPAGTEVARDTSDASGNYHFNTIQNGSYLLSYDKYTADTMQWGDNINAIDLALIKYFIASDTVQDPSRCFPVKYKKAANVDNNSSINAIDVSRIKAKIGSPTLSAKNFPRGNWVALDTLVTIAGSSLNINLQTICYGDYNASSTKYRDSLNTWNGSKSSPADIIMTAEEQITLVDPAFFEVPLRCDSKIDDFSAMELELRYPHHQYKLVNAIMRHGNKNGTLKINPTLEEIIADNNDLLVTDENGVIRVVFATTDHFDVAAGDEMIRLGFRCNSSANPGELDFNLQGIGVLADRYGEKTDDAMLIVPKIMIQGSSADPTLNISGYPNPFRGNAIITYSIPENGAVKLQVFNAIGMLTAEPVNEVKSSGKHTITFAPAHLAEGIYTFKLDFAGTEKSGSVMLKMFYK
ncbi:MAG TPA: M14 family zinc carboxypeptidase [Bacteroidales bacterium]|nr:M14 family zinc carboxypeptidase [Bacteroidales bacterium]